MNSATHDPEDPFDALLSLESQYHVEGYNLGVADGAKAGRIEGRLFGLENGFSKFVDLGRLGGKAAVWKARLPQGPNVSADQGSPTTVVTKLEGGERLRKHVQRLCDLTDPDTLAMVNDEDAVEEFDDRVKEAKTKARLISRIVGEDDHVKHAVTLSSDQNNNADEKAKTGEMEDFVGLPAAASKGSK